MGDIYILKKDDIKELNTIELIGLLFPLDFIIQP